jgi:hypothetical protein
LENAAAEKANQVDFDEWCIVELFGHSKIAGHVTNGTIGGCSFIRVDVPNPDGEGVKFTRYLGQGSIYAINVTTREEVLRVAQILYPRPNVPIVREQQSLPEYSDADYGDDDDDDD